MINKDIINQSVDYIIQHLDQDLNAEKVADYFHYSKYYFCNSFKIHIGESLYSFIKRMKIDQSAVDIKLEKHKAIAEIGLDYGYSSSNYSTVFRNQHAVSPVEFRKSASDTKKSNPFYPNAVCEVDSFEAYNSKMEVRYLEGFSIIYERAIGNYVELKERWIQFIDSYSSYITPDTVLIERFYHDPVITDLEKCICDLCITVDGTCGLDGISEIEGGKFAIYRYEGKIQNIFYTLQGIFSIWFPNCGYEMDQRYGLNIYRSIDIKNEYVTMDLCIPVK